MASSLNASTSGGGGVITTADSSGNLDIQSGGSTVVAVTSTGATVTGTLAATGASTFTGTGKFATTIGVGNATPAASGSGITFPASQSASSDANTLDDYEEGTFTPTAQGSTVAGTGTYTSQVGGYTKIGNQVSFTIYLDYGPLTGATGNLRVAGLPFTTSATTELYNAFSLWTSGLALTASNYPAAYTNPSTNYIVLNNQPVGGGASSFVPVDTAATFIVSGRYTV